MDSMTISQVSKNFGISTRMLRYYEKEGLIESFRKDDYAYRMYDETAVARLQQILLLRRLRISVKQIKSILLNSDSAAAITVFQQNIAELEEEITALSTIKKILTQFVEELDRASDMQLHRVIPEDNDLLAAISSLRLISINFKEDQTMENLKENRKENRENLQEDLKKAEESLSKLNDVRIIYLPPSYVAAAHWVGDDPELNVNTKIDRFVLENELHKKKPDLRHYGFNHPNPADETGYHGYESWVTIPDDMEVPEPLVKKKFPGGLYAAHMITFGNFNEWNLLFEWVNNNDKYEFSGDMQDQEHMCGLMEEHLNYIGQKGNSSMSIEYQAQFWLRNVCESNLEEIRLKNHLDDETADGLHEFSCLLKKIFGGYRLFEVSAAERVRTKIGIMADDLENYHNLTETVDCLYGIAKTGEVREEGAVTYLDVPKEKFKKAFKKPVGFPFEILEQYSFYFRYYKRGTEIDAYKQCDRFQVYYDDHNTLMSAIACFAKRISEKSVKLDYAQTGVLFYTADFESVFLNKATGRNELDPKRFGIAGTLGTLEPMWNKISGILLEDLKLNYDISLNPYVFPRWNFRFIKKKKTVCSFGIGTDQLSVRLPLSYQAAEKLVLSRYDLPESIRHRIESFGCVRCGKCDQESNIVIMDGIRLCKLHYSNFVTEDSRMIAIQLTTDEEAETILRVIKEQTDGAS